MADGLHVPGVTSALEARLDEAGLIAPQGAGMNVRTGIMIGPGASALITGTATTAPMTVTVAAHHAVTTRQASEGVYRAAQEVAATVNIGAAPAADSRIDVVWVKQNDATAGVLTPDASTAWQVGVTPGTAAASPVKPAIPVGALEVGTVTVAAGASTTNGAGVTIANTARLTAARGAPVPVRNQAERDSLTTFPGLHVTRLDQNGRIQRWITGSTWRDYLDSTDIASTGGDFVLYNGYAPFAGYSVPGWELSAQGHVQLRGMVARTGANLAVGVGIRRPFAQAPAAIRTALAVSAIGWAGYGVGGASNPARIHYAGSGSTDLDLIGMDSGSGTLVQNDGFINLDGVSWFL